MGCGDGELVLDLWKCGALVTDADVSAVMIQAPRTQADDQRANIACEIGRAGQLSLQTASFDALATVKSG